LPVQNLLRSGFVSLAWQEQSIAANYEIVDEWNRLNPDIQVEYIPGSWDSIHDYMVTSFETGDVPDIFHYEAALIGDFARRGYLADLRPYIDDELWEDTFEGAWATVAGDNGEIWGMPFIWESLIILYNKDILEEAGIELPTTENPWTWDDIRSVAKELTVDFDGDGEIDQWGAAIPLRAPVNRILNLTLGFGGGYFVEEDGRYTVRVGEAEKGLLSVIMDMIYEDKSAYPGAVGLSGTAVLPAFYEGGLRFAPRHRRVGPPADYAKCSRRLPLGRTPAGEGADPAARREPADLEHSQSLQAPSGGYGVHQVLCGQRERHEIGPGRLDVSYQEVCTGHA
jgi:multiple sugar transport system substrate-binding protein